MKLTFPSGMSKHTVHAAEVLVSSRAGKDQRLDMVLSKSGKKQVRDFLHHADCHCRWTMCLVAGVFAETKYSHCRQAKN